MRCTFIDVLLSGTLLYALISFHTVIEQLADSTKNTHTLDLIYAILPHYLPIVWAFNLPYSFDLLFFSSFTIWLCVLFLLLHHHIITSSLWSKYFIYSFSLSFTTHFGSIFPYKILWNPFCLFFFFNIFIYQITSPVTNTNLIYILLVNLH